MQERRHQLSVHDGDHSSVMCRVDGPVPRTWQPNSTSLAGLRNDPRAGLDRDSEMTRQCGQLPARVSDRTFRNISDGLALSAGERVTGPELELDARFRAAEGREEQ